MSTDSQAVSASKVAFWSGWVLSVLPCLLFAFSGVMKLVKPPELSEGFTHLGWPENLALALGILELTCTVLYLIPQTAVLGAILLTGYMGGAIATHVRISEGFFMHILIGVVLWLGLYLRDARVRALIPFRTIT